MNKLQLLKCGQLIIVIARWPGSQNLAGLSLKAFLHGCSFHPTVGATVEPTVECP